MRMLQQRPSRVDGESKVIFKRERVRKMTTDARHEVYEKVLELLCGEEVLNTLSFAKWEYGANSDTAYEKVLRFKTGYTHFDQLAGEVTLNDLKYTFAFDPKDPHYVITGGENKTLIEAAELLGFSVVYEYDETGSYNPYFPSFVDQYVYDGFTALTEEFNAVLIHY